MSDFAQQIHTGEKVRRSATEESRILASSGRIGKCLNLFSRKNDVSSGSPVLTESQFRAVIYKERHRADRNGHGFSLVGFDLKNPDTTAASKFVENLVTSCRATDDIGWFEGATIGILLFNTAEPQARAFARSAANGAVMNLGMDLEYGVWSYPSDWSASKEEGKGRDACQDSDKQIGGNGKGHTTSRSVENWNGDVKACPGTGIPAEKHHLRHALRSLMFPEALPVWKRMIDIIGSSIGLVLLSPLFLCVAILIKMVSPGPVLFKQERVGYSGRRFTLWKFRTMHVNNDSSRHRAALAEMIHAGDKNERRPMTKLDDTSSDIIRFGHLLRKATIDELPQLVNVLRGEMSLVGPRPPIPYEANEYLRWHNGRFDAVPGMTGLWQVSGKNSLTFNEMARLDIQYSRNRTFWLDLEILVRTPLVVLQQAVSSATAPSSEPQASVKTAVV